MTSVGKLSKTPLLKMTRFFAIVAKTYIFPTPKIEQAAIQKTFLFQRFEFITCGNSRRKVLTSLKFFGTLSAILFEIFGTEDDFFPKKPKKKKIPILS